MSFIDIIIGIISYINEQIDQLIANQISVSLKLFNLRKIRRSVSIDNLIPNFVLSF
jgi:hypothetical protein